MVNVIVIVVETSLTAMVMLGICDAWDFLFSPLCLQQPQRSLAKLTQPSPTLRSPDR